MQDLPSWVFFPDFERSEWLNRLQKSLFYANQGFKDMNFVFYKYNSGNLQSIHFGAEKEVGFFGLISSFRAENINLSSCIILATLF